MLLDQIRVGDCSGAISASIVISCDGKGAASPIASAILARHGLTNHYPAGADVLARFAHLISERDARGERRRLRPN